MFNRQTKQALQALSALFKLLYITDLPASIQHQPWACAQDGQLNVPCALVDQVETFAASDHGLGSGHDSYIKRNCVIWHHYGMQLYMSLLRDTQLSCQLDARHVLTV